VHVAHDVDEALVWAREHKPDLVTVDTAMHDVDGLALVEILRHDPDTRRAGVVVVSANADRDSALLAGADAYFSKPVEVDPLRATCMRILAEKARESHVKVLVVDDDAGIRMICREVLEKAGYVVREASDGKSALTEAKRFRPDLMLLDVMMPDLDGFQTVKRFRADRDGAMTPVIFVSARGQIADKIRAFKLGAEDYLVKPFDSMELVARVEKALERRERELGASPTTKLPGAGAIEAEIERRLAEGGDFAFCYVDLDNLKAFNDYYGIAKADGVIRQTGDLMRQVVTREGTAHDFIGHIAGDDFVFITTPDRVDRIAETICTTFDRLVPLYYDKADRERGYIETYDRYGQLRKFPLLSVSIASLTTRGDDMRYRTYAELALASADAKKRAKAVEGSSYVRDGIVVWPQRAKSVA
jgi:DNA-binding response OmpR family regulator